MKGVDAALDIHRKEIKAASNINFTRKRTRFNFDPNSFINKSKQVTTRWEWLKNAVFKILLESAAGLGKGNFGRKLCEGVALKEKMREEVQNDNAFWLLASIFKCNVLIPAECTTINRCGRRT
jgi:hypothetical protein